jgi:hypothetical protein
MMRSRPATNPLYLKSGQLASFFYKTQIQNKRTQTSKPPVGFEPTISALERAKTGVKYGILLLFAVYAMNS